MNSIPIGFDIVLIGIAAVFAYHLLLGWRTGIVRFPLSVLVFQEFERDRSPENFWGIMIANMVGLITALIVATLAFWRVL